jgi:four helix bundle protein
MRKYQRFEEVPVWQEATRLYHLVLDVLEEANVPLSATARNQLERAALCVSSAVAEGFEGATPAELVSLLKMARGAAIEVQSMLAVLNDRPKLARLLPKLQEIRNSADACGRQLSAWKFAIENPGGYKRPAADGQAPRPSDAPHAPAGPKPPNSAPPANRP